jgi:hypothetical protein
LNLLQPMSDLPRQRFDFDSALLRAHAEALERTYRALEPSPMLAVPKPGAERRLVAAGKYMDGTFTVSVDPAWGGAR